MEVSTMSVELADVLQRYAITTNMFQWTVKQGNWWYFCDFQMPNIDDMTSSRATKFMLEQIDDIRKELLKKSKRLTSR